MLKGILIDTKTGKHTITEIEDELKEFYRILDCERIDIVKANVGEQYFDIYCDDEGLYRPTDTVPVVTVLDISNEFDNQPMVVGNVFICKHDGQGGARSLTDEEIKHVEFYINACAYFVDKEDGGEDVVIQEMLLATY